MWCVEGRGSRRQGGRRSASLHRATSWRQLSRRPGAQQCLICVPSPPRGARLPGPQPGVPSRWGSPPQNHALGLILFIYENLIPQHQHSSPSLPPPHTHACVPGTTAALVGESGSGKSTVVQLLLRLYDPAAGAVLLDGADLRSLSLAWLRSQVGLVGQSPTLFASTIFENIALASGAGMEAVVQAAITANAHGFIIKLPNGWAGGGRGGVGVRDGLCMHTDFCVPGRDGSSQSASSSGFRWAPCSRGCLPACLLQVRHGGGRARRQPQRRAAPAHRHRTCRPAQPQGSLGGGGSRLPSLPATSPIISTSHFCSSLSRCCCWMKPRQHWTPPRRRRCRRRWRA